MTINPRFQSSTFTPGFQRAKNRSDIFQNTRHIFKNISDIFFRSSEKGFKALKINLYFKRHNLSVLPPLFVYFQRLPRNSCNKRRSDSFVQKKLSGALPEFRKDAGIFWHLLIYQPYEFIDIRNSSLFAVFSSLSFTNVIASTGFISAIYLRRIHIRSSV